MIKNILHLGDASAYFDFGSEVNEQVNSRVISYFIKIKELQKQIDGIINLTPSYNKLIISFDLNKINFKKIKEIVQDLKVDIQNKKNNKKIEIPICCEEGLSLDFKRLNKLTGKSKLEILEYFFNKEYFCYMTGFIAGMPFLGDLNENIRCDRLETPRVKMPKGSVGITEQFANIYTFESPGGWNIIGNTPRKIFDEKNLDQPALVNPGDKVSFYQITKEEYLNWNE